MNFNPQALGEYEGIGQGDDVTGLNAVMLGSIADDLGTIADDVSGYDEAVIGEVLFGLGASYDQIEAIKNRLRSAKMSRKPGQSVGKQIVRGAKTAVAAQTAKLSYDTADTTTRIFLSMFGELPADIRAQIKAGTMRLIRHELYRCTPLIPGTENPLPLVDQKAQREAVGYTNFQGNRLPNGQLMIITGHTLHYAVVPQTGGLTEAPYNGALMPVAAWTNSNDQVPAAANAGPINSISRTIPNEILNSAILVRRNQGKIEAMTAKSLIINSGTSGRNYIENQLGLDTWRYERPVVASDKDAFEVTIQYPENTAITAPQYQGPQPVGGAVPALVDGWHALRFAFWGGLVVPTDKTRAV